MAGARWKKKIRTAADARAAGKVMSKRRAEWIDAEVRYKKSDKNRTEGPKEQVIGIYTTYSRDVAIQKGIQLGYDKEICECWIKEFEFQRQIQCVCREKGKDEALKLFNELNEKYFDGKYRKITFLNWVKNITRDNGAR